MSVFSTRSYVVAPKERFKAISSLGGGVMPPDSSPATGSMFGDTCADIEPPFSWSGALIVISILTAISSATFAAAALWRLS